MAGERLLTVMVDVPAVVNVPVVNEPVPPDIIILAVPPAEAFGAPTV